MKLQHTVPHALGLTRARDVLEQAFAHYQERYPHANMQRHWLGDREAQVELKVGGFKLNPKISVGETQVAVDMEVPLLARPWVPRIKERIEREIGRWLEQAKAGSGPA